MLLKKIFLKTWSCSFAQKPFALPGYAFMKSRDGARRQLSGGGAR
jgi:hypothetical protein